jgi:hypothetical protein
VLDNADPEPACSTTTRTQNRRTGVLDERQTGVLDDVKDASLRWRRGAAGCARP